MPSTSGWDVHQQTQSLLFKLPPELRIPIFKAVLAVYDPRAVPHDFRIKHHHDGDPDDDGVDIETELEEYKRRKRDRNDGEAVGGPGSAQVDSKQTLSKHEHISRYGVDPDKPWHKPWYENEWIRPGCTGGMKVDTAVLRTCRRIYLEAVGYLPAKYRRYVYWRCRDYHLNPPFPNFLSTMHSSLEQGLTSLHLYTEEEGFQWVLFKALANSKLRALEHLRLSVCIEGEECFDRGIQPVLNRFETDGQPIMEGSIHDCRDFGRLPAAETHYEGDPEWMPSCMFWPDAWGLAFWHVPRIKTLVFDFDIQAGLRGKMERIIEWAQRAWHFPLPPTPDGCAYLSARGNPIQKMSWRGVKGHWQFECPTCYTNEYVPGDVWDQRDCDACDRQAVLEARNLGPRMYTWTMTWTPRVGETWTPPPGTREIFRMDDVLGDGGNSSQTAGPDEQVSPERIAAASISEEEEEG